MDIPKPSRTCSITDREFKSGEPFFSVLTEEKGKLLRRDVGVESWRIPSDSEEELIGWWKTKMPEIQERKDKPAPNDALLKTFEDIILQPDGGEYGGDLLYMLTLLLIRRRLFRYEREETNEEGRNVLVVYELKGGTNYEVPIIMPNQERLSEIQDALSKIMYT